MSIRQQFNYKQKEKHMKIKNTIVWDIQITRQYASSKRMHMLKGFEYTQGNIKSTPGCLKNEKKIKIIHISFSF